MQSGITATENSETSISSVVISLTSCR